MTAPVVFLMGPTATGKTELACALAERLPVEIISVDSAMVYRGLDIGTAKPPPEVRARFPHRLVDVADPAERYSAGRFVREATEAVEQAHARGRLPLLVGGTMLYFHALERGLAPLPEAVPEVRAAIDAEAAERGWPALHAELARVDPQAAARIRPHDAQRIQRALEIWRVTGRSLSWWQARGGRPAPWPLTRIALVPSDRAALHARIERRFQAMLDAGFLEEVARLRARGDLDPTLPAIRAVGYRQAWAHLDGAVGREEMAAQAVAATRGLARRQLTWLRRWPGLVAVDPLDPRCLERVAAMMAPLAGNSAGGAASNEQGRARRAGGAAVLQSPASGGVPRASSGAPQRALREKNNQE
ncbi:tRNA dimethylallyltransferase [Inmirania thermothiophila]|uniref:tRNA dimethylallyltransferase n=1 Tax=Inmirania thermothiophila TaxID=1750597 RepID=A0A3N1Y0J2_9GAMM|nr:tRNA dimethylallyltransferase [Inmirania thermothiophila]